MVFALLIWINRILFWLIFSWMQADEIDDDEEIPVSYHNAILLNQVRIYEHFES